MLSEANDKMHLLLFADFALDSGCSYILSFIHIWLSGYYWEQWGESCLFLRQQYTYYGMENELIVAEKQKDEQWYLKMELIKWNNKPTSLQKPGEMWIKLKWN